MENLGLIVLLLPDGSFVQKEVVRPGSEKGVVIFFEDIVAIAPDCRAAAYQNAISAIARWRSDHPENYGGENLTS
jgi:hypothetical protein